MIPLDSATAIFPRMPTGRTIAGEFPLTIIKPPVVDVKCGASPSAISSPIYRLLRSRNQRRNSSASSARSFCSAKTEYKQILPERVDVFELKDATRPSMQIDSVLRGHGLSTCTLPDNIDYCQGTSVPSRRSSLVSSAKERLVSLHDQTLDATEIYDSAKQLQTQGILLIGMKQNNNLTEVESKQNDNYTAVEVKENDKVSVVQTQQDDDTSTIETKLNEDCPTLKTKLDKDCPGTKQNGNSSKDQANQRNTKKLCKARKMSKKRRKSVKKSPGMTSIFSRLVGTHGYKKNQGQLPNSKQGDPKATSQQSKDNSNKYLNIQKLHATYAPKKTDNKSNTAILLPKVSNTSLTTDNNNSNHVHSTPSSPRKHQELELNVSVISPRSSLSQKLLNSDDDRVKKIYLSDAHSGMITGVPCAPPSTPIVDELKKVEYIPSLTDVKSQRAVKARLVTLGNKIRADEQKKKEKAVKEEQKRAYGAILELKQRQRAEIYALNKVMTDLENENFKIFMEENSAETLPV